MKEMGIEELLAGTPLLGFLQELAAINAEDIVDDLHPIKAGEIVLGEMTPFEKRLNLWHDRRCAEIKVRYRELQNSCVTCTACATSIERPAACDALHAFSHDTQARFAFMWDSLRGRFPDAMSLGLRRGFRVVTNVRNGHSSTGVHAVGVISPETMQWLSEALGKMSSL